uniref:Uncharacterized protein n=1 Tax=Meloidogyne enterolobii TaxID=390850 RepID=A0A6V7WFM9_MELEN|nr:unnamed protein product [Meloidogyne enterolobii]
MLSKYIKYLTSIFCLIYQVLSCSPPPPNPFKNTENSPTYNHQISNKLLGDKTYQQQNKTAIRFNDRVSVLSGPIKIPEELHCYDFNDKCRWRNMDGLLVDELDWYQGAGFLDENRLRLTTGTHLLPDGFYGIAASDKVELPGTKAILVSDVIECQNGQANLRFQHWTSPEVRITVCVKSVLRLFPYFDYCSKPVENGNGPVFLTLPELNAPMQIFIQAHNFVFNSAVLHGGFAIIDNLEYFGEFCDRENNKLLFPPPNKSGLFRENRKFSTDAKISSDNSSKTNGVLSIFDMIFRGNSNRDVQINQEKIQKEGLITPTFLQTVNETNAEISDKQSDKQPTIPFSQHGLRSINILQRKMPKISEKGKSKG